MITIIKNGKFTGTQYTIEQFSKDVQEFHKNDTWVEHPRFDIVPDENGDVDYGKPTQNQILEALQSEMTNAIQNLLDSKAKEYRYDDIKSARSAGALPLFGNETDTEIKMHNEAQYLANWERSVWAKSSDIEADVYAGLRSMPTVDEVLAELPTFEGI